MGLSQFLRYSLGTNLGRAACHYAFFNEKFYIQYILIIFFPLTLNFSQRLGIQKSLYFREQIWCMFNTSHDDPSNIDSKSTPLTNTATVKHMCTRVSWDEWNPCARTGFYSQIVDKHRISELLLTQKQTVTMKCSCYIKRPAQCLPRLTHHQHYKGLVLPPCH